MLIKLEPNEFSLGLRVKNLIYADLSKCAEMISDYHFSGQIDELNSQLVNASSTYIVALEKIHKNMLINDLH